PGQVIARIRLRVAEFARLLHDGRERHAAVIDIEQVGQRAGEDAFDALDGIARLAQVAQRLDDRKAGADRALIEIVRAALAPRLAQRLVIADVGAVGLLVGRDDVDAGGQPGRVVAGD